MPASVRAVVDTLGELPPGEQAVVNDPYAGGTHLNDVTVVAPVWVDSALAGWVANRAHHADVGGAEPGSIPAGATHVAQEGLRLPPVRLTAEVRSLFVAASRTPDERAGDLDAQLGANRLGADRLAAIVAEGWPLAEALAYGERRMRAALAELPDGTWSATDVLDSLGEGLPPGRLAVQVTVDGEAITFDFTGTDPQSPGNVNAVRAVTESAVAFAVRSATDPTIPANGGALRPVRVVAPEGTLVAATWPAAVGAGNVEVSQRVADVCLRALADVAPDRVAAASQGTMNNVLVGGAGWVYYETIAGGQGGRPGGPPGMSGVHTGMTNTDQVDYRSSEPCPGQSGIHTAMTNTDQVDYRSSEPRPGQSGIHTAMTNTRNTPIEALERAFPLRVLRYRLRRGSGGAGWSAGGEGIERDLQVLEDATVSLITERRVSQPWGLAGGEPGAVGENWLLPSGDERLAERLPDKCTIQLKAGDVLRMLTPGGGGWGEP
jgi:N-methylhydantoinase B/oxoprolinase/acetone carboxylase alpha subunit